MIPYNKYGLIQASLYRGKTHGFEMGPQVRNWPRSD